MHMKRMKLHKLLIVLALLTVLLPNSVVFAAEEDKSDLSPYVDDGTLSVAKCISKGNLDFILFLNASIFADGFSEGLIEPFKDVINRNACHSLDVLGLINQRDKIRSQIRDAFLTCNTQKLPALEQAYNEVNAEIYYVRHLVDAGVVASLPFDVLNTRKIQVEGGKEVSEFFYPTEKLAAEMREKYVETNKISADKFTLFFSNLEYKYRDRKNSYVICENSSWQAVAEKWEEFIETAGGITPAWNDLEKGVQQKAEGIAEAATDGSFTDFLGGIVQFKVNNLDPAKGFDEISQNLSQYVPKGSSDIASQSSLLSAVQSSGQSFDVKKMREEMAANIEAEYKTVSDATVKLFVDELNNWEQILADSLKPLDGIYQKTECIADKQCSSSE